MSNLFLNSFRAVFLSSMCLFLMSCSMLNNNSNTAIEVKEHIVWPMPPAQPRIKFVSEFSEPKDLGIKPGGWSKLIKWITGGEDGARLVRPTAVVVTSKEVVFVADPGSGGVHRFDTKRKKHDLVLLKDKAFLRSPVALAIGSENRVYVSDSALNQILYIDEGAKVAVPFKTSIALDQPTGITLANGRLYVVNTRQHEVLAFDLDGQLLFRFAQRGQGDGEFNYPTMIWSDPATQRLWVTDSLNFRIQQFDEKGKFISSFGKLGNATGDLSRPRGVAVDSDGHIYVMDALFNSMQIFNLAGDLLLYVGEQGQKAGQFWLPAGIFIDNKDNVYIADSFNSRIQVFKYIAQ